MIAFPPRSVRNNNPGNLRRTGTVWRGELLPGEMTQEQAEEKEFCVFKDVPHGFRALGITLVNYQKLHGLNTIAAIVGRFAPPTENDTAAYVQHVCALTNFFASDPLNLLNPGTLRSLCKAIATHEAGAWLFEFLDLQAGVGMALLEFDAPELA